LGLAHRAADRDTETPVGGNRPVADPVAMPVEGTHQATVLSFDQGLLEHPEELLTPGSKEALSAERQPSQLLARREVRDQAGIHGLIACLRDHALPVRRERQAPGAVAPV